MQTHPDIVVTGMGLVTNLGRNPQSTWEAILAGTRAFGPASALEQIPAPDKGGGQAVELPTDFLPDRVRESRYLRYAINDALEQAGDSPAPPLRRAAIFGTTLHGMRAGGRYLRTLNLAELKTFLPSSVLDQALAGLSICGPRLTNCSACSSGLASIALAITLLATGEMDLVIAGGYDPISEYSYAGFESLRLVAAGAPRPFAADRDGMKVAEGYGALVLERAETAQARGARPLARIAAIAETSDAFHLTQPHPQGEGASAAIRSSLQAAHIELDTIDMICAHGTATPNNDAAEYAAMKSVFNGTLHSVPVTALKSHLGHTLGAAGAVELIVSILARRNGTVPPVAGVAATDPAFEDLRLAHSPTPRPIRASLHLSLGFGGANTCAVLAEPRAPAASSTGTRRPVVITGLGVILPGAVGNQEFSKFLSHPDRQPTQSKLSDEQLEGFINARRVRRMSGYAKLVLAAANQACLSAEINDKPELLGPCAAILATTHGSSLFCHDFYSQVVREGIAAANPVLFAEGVPNAASAQLSLALGLRGGCQTIIGTRSALIDAFALAAMRIGMGDCERAFVGAGEEHFEIVDQAYAQCGQNNGFASSSGAVMFVLESLESARHRNAPVLATYVNHFWNSRGAESLAGLNAQFAPGISQPQVGAGDRFKELFSVGPGITLAAAIMQPAPAHSRLAIGSVEFSGDAAAAVFDIHLRASKY